MKNSTYIFLLAIAFLTVSCEKQIDFRGDEQSPMVVVVSEPQPETNLAVRLTYSRFFLSGGNFRVIDNADVKVKVNGTTFTGLFDGSVYRFPYSPAEGDSINLTVRMQNGGEDTVVTAATRMPFRPSVTVRESMGDTYHFVLNDRPGEKNYYSMHIATVDSVVNFYDRNGNFVYDPDDTTIVVRDTLIDTVWRAFGCSDGALTSDVTSSISISGDDAYAYYQLFFTDEMFDGQNREVTIKCEANTPYSTYKGRKAGKSIALTVLLYIETLSKEAYLYELSRFKQQNDDIFMTEPVQVQSNINGGLGIFGAKASRIVTLGAATRPADIDK